MFGRRSAFLSLCTLLLPVFAQLAGAANVVPEVVTTPSAATLRAGAAAAEVSLAGAFRDPDVTGSVVRIGIRIGTVTRPVHIALNDSQTPLTVANFLKYVRDGRYLGSFMHRSEPGFVVQGGGFYWNAGQIASVPTYGTVQNEPGISNVRGTVAMAKLGDNPNSATSQWFVSLADNSANLDVQNGGFTVFGRVVGDGMAVFDDIAALPRYNAGGAFGSLPLKDVYGTQLLREFTVETMSAAEVRALTYSATSSDPDLVAATVADDKLVLTPSSTRTGAVDVTIRATDLDGATVETTIPVTVRARSAGWSTTSLENGGYGYTFNPSNPATFPSDAVSAQVSHALVGDSRDISFTVENGGKAAMTGVYLLMQGANTSDFSVLEQPSTTIAAGGASTFKVRFKPTAAGTRQVRLLVGAAGPEATSFQIDLTGRGALPPAFSGLAAQELAAATNDVAVLPDLRGNPVVVASDDGIAEVTQSPPPGSTLPVGTHTVRFTARTSLGYTATADLSVLVHHARPANAELFATGAYAGAPAPQAGGGDLPAGSTMSSFGEPAISDLRHLAARATIATSAGARAAIYTENAAGDQALAAVQNGASGVAGGVFRSFLDPVLSSTGKLAFAAKLTGVAVTEDEGVWSDVFGPLAPVLREGQPTPGLAATKVKSVTSISVSDDSLTALVKLMPQRAAVVAGVDDTALVRLTGNGTGTLLARTAAAFENTRVKRISVLQPAARSGGHGRWESGRDTLANFTLQDGRTVLVKISPAGQATRLLQTGTADAKYPSALSALGLPAGTASGAAIGVTKRLGPGVLRTNDTSLLVSRPDGTFLAAVDEDGASGVAGGARFATFSDPVANDLGSLLFYATLRGGTGVSANSAGLWARRPDGQLRALARLSEAPMDETGTPMAGATLSAISSFALPNGAATGALVVGQMTGSGVPANQRLGLWAEDATGALRLVFRSGWELPIGDAKKAVGSFRLLTPLPGSFGVRRSYSATGSIALLVTFADRTTAVLRLDLP